LKFPAREEGFPRILLLGVPGAGKTTLVRQMIGSHPGRDRFPATSINRTTTFETEVIAGLKDFSAAVTFMSEEEADFEVRQSISSAILRAVDDQATNARVAKALLERSDMRFRLKYVLGDWPTEEVDDDPYATEGSTTDDEPNDASVSQKEAEEFAAKVRAYVATIREVAARHKQEAEAQFGSLASLASDERNKALDWLQDMAEQSDQYSMLVSELLDDLRDKFDEITIGRLIKTTTGWPRLWLHNEPASKRSEFFSAVRYFSGIDRGDWGKLLTPLVNGIRVAGPFVPSWAAEHHMPRFILIDTEGLGHKANTIPDVPDYIVSRFPECDAILLVHKGDVPFGFEGGKALEAIGGAGHTAKTTMIFTRMDEVKGPNIQGWHAKRDYSFSGVRNVVENQIAKVLSPDVARFMLSQLENSAFYLGSLQKSEPTAAKTELSRLLGFLTSIVPPPPPAPAFPDYGSYDLLVLKLQKGVEDFRIPWRAYLSIQRSSGYRPLPWQSVKAVSRRYAEGFDDGYEIRPASNLLNSMTLAIARFLENPIEWSGSPSPEDKRFILDRIKAAVSKKLTRFCVLQLREKAQPDWQIAYGFRGSGSTFDRRLKIESLYERWVPEPATEADDMLHIQEFVDGMKKIVTAAIDETRDALIKEAEATSSKGSLIRHST
jgi:adenylate kinase family enzyme